MPKHAEQRSLPFTQDQLFDLVADVAKYPEFLPWCVATRIKRQTETEMVADMVIGFKAFREGYTSRVTLSHPNELNVAYENGPFKYLKNTWKFIPEDNGNCIIDFYVDFEFKSRILEKAIGLVFEEAVHKMVSAFVTRAEKIYP